MAAAVRKKWKGPDALTKHLVPVGSVKPDLTNARNHSDDNVETIRKSFDANGQVQLLVVYEGEVQAGNARLKASKLLKWTHVAVVDVTDWFESKEQATAFALMDNKSAEMASWNFEQASKHFKTLPDKWRALTGFKEFEWEPLVKGLFTPHEPGVMPGTENKGVSFWSTNAQAGIIRRAIDKLKSDEGDEDISDGRALELICGDYVSGS